MSKTPARIGRPTKTPKPGERVSLGLRVTADLKRKLDEAAKKSGRSQSQEAELRLERSFEREALLPEVLTLACGERLGNTLHEFIKNTTRATREPYTKKLSEKLSELAKKTYEAYSEELDERFDELERGDRRHISSKSSAQEGQLKRSPRK